MTILTEQDINAVTEILGITKERLLNIDEEGLLAEINKAKQKIEEAALSITEKDKQINALHSECTFLNYGIQLLLRHKRSNRQET